MKGSVSRAFALGGAFLLSSVLLLAHHGTSISFDLENPVTLKGVVTEFKWANPHIFVQFDAVDEDGDMISWSVECGSPYNWAREGFSRNTLKSGDEITVTVYPGRSGNSVGLLWKLELSDGRTIFDQPRG